MLWVIMCAALVLIMQAGFLCLESGCTRTKNSINVAVKNITDFGISVLVFWAVGFGLMFGASSDGLLGTSGFFLETDKPSDFWQTGFFLFQAMFCGTSVTIVSGAVAERMSFKGYLFISVIISALIYPIFGHWAWGGALEGEPGWLSALGFIDFAGSTVVHSVGGWVALAAIIVIGPRLGRFDTEGGGNGITGQSLPLAMLGALILCFGWIGFNGGSALSWNETIPSIITHTILAAASGLVVALTIGWIKLRYPSVKYCMNGMIAGLVAITASCHIVSAPDSIAIGAVGALFMIVADQFLEKIGLDDVVGAFPVHAVAGVWGTLAVALFGDPASFPDNNTIGEQLAVQALGVATCAAVSFIPAYLLLLGIRQFCPIRVAPKDEIDGLNASEHKVSTEYLDLLREMQAQSETLDIKRRVSVEPFTEVGQIAAKYNEVLDSLEQTMARNELIVRDTKDGILTCDTNGRILSANPGAESMFGYSASEFAELSTWNIVGANAQARFADFREFLDYAQGQNRSLKALRMMGLNKSGNRFHIEMEIATGFVGAQEIRTLKVRDRSLSELYQERLMIAKSEAERARDALQEKVSQIETFNHMAVDRESRMMELKQEINRLSSSLGKAPPFSFASEDTQRN